MSKLGPREAKLRAMREAQFDERQQRHQPAKRVAPPETVSNASPAVSPSPNTQVSPNKAYARNQRWRIKNRDRYNATMRNLMRRLRAEAKA